MARNRQNSPAEGTESTDVASQEPTTAETAKVTRQPVDVGQVTIAPSTATSLPTRESKLDTEPLAVAVRDAEPGIVYDVLVDPDKVKAAESILVRAGARHGRGVNKRVVTQPDGSGDAAPREDGKILIRFTTGARRVRKAKETAPTDNAETVNAESTEPTPDEAEPQHDEYAFSNTY